MRPLATVLLMLVTSTMADTYRDTVRPFLDKHCLRCHGPKKQKGELRLDTLRADFSSSSTAGQWIEVMDNLNLGEMPPEDEPQPSAEQRRRIANWIARQIRTAQRRAAGGGGRVLLRRLNRTEYANTIRDLLHLKFLPGENPARHLPPDATYDGFDKVGSALMIDPSLLDSFYRAGKEVAGKVLVNGPPPVPTRTVRFEFEDSEKHSFKYMLNSATRYLRKNDLALYSGTTRVGDALQPPDHHDLIPRTGLYTIRIRIFSHRAQSQQPLTLIIDRISGKPQRILEVDVNEKPTTYETTVPMIAFGDVRPRPYFSIGITNRPDIKIKSMGFGEMKRAREAAAKSGEVAKGMRIHARMFSEGYVDTYLPNEKILTPERFPTIYLDWIELEGPLYESWPPRSHEALLASGRDVRAIFSRLLPRAYRRPPKDSEIDKVVSLVTNELKQGTAFDEAIELGLSYVLTSPQFIYLVEPGSNDARSLNGYELASRLSYFIWSSMPDDRLFELAKTGAVKKPEVIKREVFRMLNDPKARAMTDSFAAQWLRTDQFLDFSPDRKIYRRFNPSLQEDMIGESLAFFRQVLEKRLSIFNFIDSEFAMLNGPLADFYGIPGLRGKKFRPVSLPTDSPRGGLLGQAGLHILGSDGRRTKPVTRGVYIREVLFNDPPNPPPPNAGEVEPNIEGEQLTVRQRLEQHQQIEACASCHRGIDPYGIAMENWDATGSWRTQQNGEDFRGKNTPPIDPRGKLPNGKAFGTFEEFKRVLSAQKQRFRRAFAEKLFVYGIGRPVDPLDREAIDSVIAHLANNGDTIEAAIQGLVQTKAFRTK